MEGVRPEGGSEPRADLKGNAEGVRGMVPVRPAGRSVRARPMRSAATRSRTGMEDGT